jgi:hypothetical protein
MLKLQLFITIVVLLLNHLAIYQDYSRYSNANYFWNISNRHVAIIKYIKTALIDISAVMSITSLIYKKKKRSPQILTIGAITMFIGSLYIYYIIKYKSYYNDKNKKHPELMFTRNNRLHLYFTILIIDLIIWFLNHVNSVGHENITNTRLTKIFVITSVFGVLFDFLALRNQINYTSQKYELPHTWDTSKRDTIYDIAFNKYNKVLWVILAMIIGLLTCIKNKG